MGSVSEMFSAAGSVSLNTQKAIVSLYRKIKQINKQKINKIHRHLGQTF